VTFEQLRHFHRQPRVIGAWQALWGPVLPWLLPRRRRVGLALGGVLIAVSDPLREVRSISRTFCFTPDAPGAALVVVALAAFALGWYAWARRFASWPAWCQRHPQLCLHASYWAWLLVVWNVTPQNVTARTVLFGAALVLPLLLWRLGYLLMTAQRGKMAGTTLADHWFYLWPVWGGTAVPYGKGLDYLSACEARDPEALARSQLAGLKLFLLAALCGAAKGVLDGCVFGQDNAWRRALGGATLGIPPSAELMASGAPFALWKGWVSIYAELFRSVLAWGAKGHVVIGYLRLAGFYVFRNTYKPLLAETIVEFWNRYYYYFKELLVHFFFFPTFTRHFKRQPRLRMGAAVFAAAFFGNLYYHVIKAPAFLRGDWAAVWAQFNPRLLYCFALALGIFLSMQREQRRPRTVVRPPVRRALAIFSVWTFFAFIHLWARGNLTHGQRLHFLLGLFGLG
jgi:hypothetical protein